MGQTRLTQLDSQVLKFLLCVDEFQRVCILSLIEGKRAIDVIKHGLSLTNSLDCLILNNVLLGVVAIVGADWRSARARLLMNRLTTRHCWD